MPKYISLYNDRLDKTNVGNDKLDNRSMAYRAN